jgi:hypothetical protein
MINNRARRRRGPNPAQNEPPSKRPRTQRRSCLQKTPFPSEFRWDPEPVLANDRFRSKNGIAQTAFPPAPSSSGGEQPSTVPSLPGKPFEQSRLVSTVKFSISQSFATVDAELDRLPRSFFSDISARTSNRHGADPGTPPNRLALFGPRSRLPHGGVVSFVALIQLPSGCRQSLTGAQPKF